MKWISIIVLSLAVLDSTVHCSGWWTEVIDFTASIFNYERCNDQNISPSLANLQSEFSSKLFGQDLIVNRLIPVLDGHFRITPKKALVICMHGWTGSGKNYATKILVENVFRKKEESSFVKFFNGRIHFPSDRYEDVERYKANLQEWIRTNVTACPRSLFVFDELDKIPTGVIDAIKPYLDYHSKVDGVDYSKAIFIFLSNIGGGLIKKIYMDLWRSGLMRNDMKYSQFETHLRDALYRAEGGFGSSSILDSHLVSLYLPFLPMDVEHVKKCVVAEMERQRVQVTDEKIDSIVADMEFDSDGLSTSGCKRVVDLVAIRKFDFLDEL